MSSSREFKLPSILSHPSHSQKFPVEITAGIDKSGLRKTPHNVRSRNSSNGNGGIANTFDFIAIQLFSPGFALWLGSLHSSKDRHSYPILDALSFPKKLATEVGLS